MPIVTELLEVHEWELEKALPRFLSKIRNYSNYDMCWIWDGTINNAGYGRFSFKGKYWLAHRWIYLYCYGELSAKLVIDHRCNNTPCVNPVHLEEVSIGENMRRGRANKPPDLIPDFALEIKEAIIKAYYVNYVTQDILATKFNMSKYAVRQILLNTGRKRESRIYRTDIPDFA